MCQSAARSLSYSSSLPPVTATVSAPATAVVTPPPAATQPPTMTPTLAATPLPLSAHAWDAAPVLVRYDDAQCVDFCGGESFSPHPAYLLYADGRLITRQRNPGSGALQLRQRQLPRQEMCALLNTFDAIGLFDYDPSAFYEADRAFPRMTAPADLWVNAWRAASLSFGGMRDYLPGPLRLGNLIPDAPMLRAYHLVQGLDALPATEPFIPQAYLLELIELAPDQDVFSCCFADEGGAWSLPALPLAGLYERSAPVAYWTPARRVAVDGAEAEALRVWVGDRAETGPTTYEEGERRFVVAIRGLLPYESPAGVGGPGDVPVIPGPDVVAPTQPLACSPADGVASFYEAAVQAADRQQQQITILSGQSRATPPPVETSPPSPKDIFEP